MPVAVQRPGPVGAQSDAPDGLPVDKTQPGPPETAEDSRVPSSCPGRRPQASLEFPRPVNYPVHMRWPVILLAACLTPVPASGQQVEREAADPYACGDNEVSVYNRRKDQWICKPRLETKRDLFSAPKHPKDPCPDNYWWHRTRNDMCRPIICMRRQNQSDLSKGMCPQGHHPHLNTGADWVRPISCVEDFRPRNLKTGGKHRRPGKCEVCTIKEHAYRIPGWQFDRPSKKKKKKKRRGTRRRVQSSRSAFTGFGNQVRVRRSKKKRRKGKRAPCGAGYRTDQEGFCVKCPKDAATAKLAGDRTVCVGGVPEPFCPAGAGLVPTDMAHPSVVCAPCLDGEESLTLDGWARCARNPCEKGKLPVPDEGFVEKTSCYAPMEDPKKLDWTKVLHPARMTPAEAPACPEDSGLRYDARKKDFACRPCGDFDVVTRNGRPICGRELPPPCARGQVPMKPPGAKQRPRCAPCPKGTAYSVVKGFGHPRCLPSEERPGPARPKTRPGKRIRPKIDPGQSVPLLR